MNPPTPPDPLEELAGRLGRRRIGSPSAELAARVRDAVAAELRSASQSESRSGVPPARPGGVGASWVAFALGLAAAFVIGTSLSMIAVSDTRGVSRPAADPARARATAHAIRELAPELSEADALRMGVVDDAGPGLVCVPRLRAPDPRSVRTARLLTSLMNGNGDLP